MVIASFRVFWPSNQQKYMIEMAVISQKRKPWEKVHTSIVSLRYLVKFEKLYLEILTSELTGFYGG